MMKFKSSIHVFLLACVVVCCAAVSNTHAQEDKHSAILPAETVVAVSFHKPTKTSALNWKKSGLSKLSNHKGVANFFTALQENAKRNRKAKPFAKVNLQGLWKIIDRRLTFAWTEQNNQLQMLVVADVDSNQEEAKKWLQQLEQNFRSNRIAAEKSPSNVRIVSYRLPNRIQSGEIQFAHAMAEGKIFMANSKQLLERVVGGQSAERSLAMKASFRATTKLVQSKQTQDSIWWYVRPIELGKAASAGRRTKEKKADQNFTSADFFRLASVEGYDAIRAAGGTAAIDDDGALILTAKISANRPFKNSMRLLNLPNQKMFRLPGWANDGASSVSLFSIPFRSLLGNFSTLFDQLFGEGEQGVFELVLDDIQSDPKGPRVDLQGEVFNKLGDTISVTSVKKSPTKSVRVFAAATSDPAAVASAIDRLYRGDAQARRITDAKFPAWNVQPIQNDPAGGKARRAYVIAVRGGFVLIGPTLGDIDSCFAEQSKRIDETGEYKSFVTFANARLGSELCLLNYGRFDRWAERKVAEIHQGKVTGMVGLLLEQLGWSELLPALGSEMPGFDELRSMCNGHLGVAGKATRDGWDVVVRLRTFGK